MKLGDQVEIFRDVPTKENPTNPKALPPVSEQVGLATVTEVADDYAIATFSGSGHVQVGDHIRGLDNARALPH